MNEVVTIFLTIIVLFGVIAVFYIILYNNLQAHKIKINESESVIDDLLRKKFDLLMSIKKIILEETDVNKKSFDELKELENQNISSFDFERKLTVTNNLIDQIKSDFPRLDDKENFSNFYEEMYNLNEKLEATKTFYNRYTSLLNKLIKNFPSNILAKIHHIEVQTYFDGKDMYDDDIKDFKL